MKPHDHSGPAGLHPELDDAIIDLQRNKAAWAALPVRARMAYLEDMAARIPLVAADWVRAAVAAKGIAHAPALAGEEWMSGPWALLRSVKQLMASLDNIARDKTPAAGLPVRTTVSGQAAVKVFPRTVFDRLLISGVQAEVWMEPGIPADHAAIPAAAAYTEPHRPVGGELALVLGAGNIASIAPLDTLYKLYTDLAVVILKLNPVNDYLGRFLEDIFALLIRDGFVRIAYGGAETGSYLCTHPAVDTLHITGSVVTHDAIVFGAHKGPTDRRRINHKPITSELGGVSPVIVVPGPWSAADIVFQAKNIATQRLHNSGFNCIASQVLVLPEGWEHAGALRQAVAHAMEQAPDRPPYYPGAEQRCRRFEQEYEGSARVIGKPMGRQVLIDIAAPAAPDAHFLLGQEAFAPVLGMVRLGYEDELDFLRQAVDFSNERLAGTLGANILIHPATLAALGPAFEQEIARLRYGCIAVNLWTAAGFLLTETSWGAFPGHVIDDVQSGIGSVHNTLLFDRPQKSVLRGPFRPFPRSILHGCLDLLPTPPWFVSHRSAHKVVERLFKFEARPSWLKIPGIVYHALRD